MLNNKPRTKRNAERRAARRAIVAGFPIPKQNLTIKQVDEYFSTDKIQCLLCGKRYNRLAAHLLLHEIGEDEYRERYGLPYKRGLTGVRSNMAYSEAMFRKRDSGIIVTISDAGRKLACKDKPQRRSAYAQQKSMTNIEKVNENVTKS